MVFMALDKIFWLIALVLIKNVNNQCFCVNPSGPEIPGNSYWFSSKDGRNRLFCESDAWVIKAF